MTQLTDDDVQQKPPSNGIILNPFVHKLELVDSVDKIKTAVLTVLILPIRVFFICWLLVTAWALACIGLYGVSHEDLTKKPMKGWRLRLKHLIAMLGRWSYLAGGMAITVKGKQAAREEAAILVLAPHSTFLDSVIVYVTNMCSIMVRNESMDNYAGKLINFTQPIYVWRDDPNSRQNTIKEIIKRANSKDDWPQTIIFPEGTCTNRSCLITFKPGAFYPGVPVQPVCIRYPNKLDTVTWTWEGPGFLKLLWLTLTRIHSNCEIEFLPVYVPNEAEKQDPKLYASNVRNVMAKALGVPVSDYTFNDCKIMTRAKNMNVPHAADIVEIEKHRRALGLDRTNSEEHIITGSLATCLVNLDEFASRLHVSAMDLDCAQLFSLFEKAKSDKIDFRQYLICALFLIKRDESIVEFLQSVSRMFDSAGNLTRDALYSTVKNTLAMGRDDSDAIFAQIQSGDQPFIKISDFIAYMRARPEYAYVFAPTDRIDNHKAKHA